MADNKPYLKVTTVIFF